MVLDYQGKGEGRGGGDKPNIYTDSESFNILNEASISDDLCEVAEFISLPCIQRDGTFNNTI